MRRITTIAVLAGSILMATPATAGNAFGNYDLDIGFRISYRGDGFRMKFQDTYSNFSAEVREEAVAIGSATTDPLFTLASALKQKGKVVKLRSGPTDTASADAAHDELFSLAGGAVGKRATVGLEDVVITSARVKGGGKSKKNGDRLELNVTFVVAGTVSTGQFAGRAMKGKLKLSLDGARDFGF